jgi:DNA-binding NarL/FixJ family response regulator
VSPHISGALVRAIQSPAEVPKEPLSIRERQVLQLVAEGKTSKEVAKTLGISRKTVESHRTRIMEKLAIHDMPGLIRYAIRRGLITPCFIAALMAFQLPGTPGFWLA